jgi:hypothetical protein
MKMRKLKIFNTQAFCSVNLKSIHLGNIFQTNLEKFKVGHSACKLSTLENKFFFL